MNRILNGLFVLGCLVAAVFVAVGEKPWTDAEQQRFERGKL